jgi:hypothetical protein
LGLSRTALEEGTRTVLEEYEEYGLPDGPTEQLTAIQNFVDCSEANLSGFEKCQREAASRDSFVRWLVFEAACELTTIARELSCEKDVAKRYAFGR